MILNRGTMSQIRTAFNKVYGTTSIDDDDIVSFGNVIINSPVAYPFEDNDMFNYRLRKVDFSDKDSVASYLVLIDDSEFSEGQHTTYGKLFDLARKYNIIHVDGDTTADINVGSNNAVGYDSVDGDAAGNKPLDEPTVIFDQPIGGNSNDTIKEKENNFEEEQKMSGNAINQMYNEMMNQGVGDQVARNESNVADVSNNDRMAARKLVEETHKDRMSYSQNAKITQVLVVGVDRASRAVKGREAKGRVSNPKKALSMFMQKTGANVVDGQVSFSKLRTSETTFDDARKMYELLLAAVEAPETEVEPYFGKVDAPFQPTIKGVVIEEPNHDHITVTMKDLPAHILRNAFLYLDVKSKDHAQFQLDAATPRAGSAPKKSYVTRIANKKAMLEDQTVCKQIKVLTEHVDQGATGFKSAMSVSCNSTQTDANGNPKKITWRIPLEVDQWEMQIVTGYEDMFKKGIGNSTKPMSVDNAEEVKSIANSLINMIAAEASSMSGREMLGENFIGRIESNKKEIVENEANAINQTLSEGRSVNAADFE